jgi:hypothetical protein
MLAAERRAAGGTTDFGSGPILPSDSASTRREICGLSGQSANAWCPNRRHEWVAAEVPGVPCSWHHDSGEGLVTVLPAEYRDWQGGARDHVQRADAAVTAVRRVEGRRADRRPPALSITSPADGSTYLIDPTLRREFQALPLKAVTTTGGDIEWTINGKAVGSSIAGSALDWPLMPGKHRLEARDSAGRIAHAEITVR